MTAEVESIEFLSNDNTNNTSGTITKSLKQILGEGNEGVYKIISSAGLTTIKLNQPLTDVSDEDYDKDGLSDWGEVNTTLIYNMYAKYNHSYPNVIKSSYLPKLADCKDYYTDITNQKVYVEKGYEIFINKNAGMYYQGDKEKAYAELSKMKILPIYSDPTKPDSDGDKIPDCIKFYTTEEYKSHISEYYVTEFDDPNPLVYETLWQWPVVSAEAVESYVDNEGNTKYRSKVDENGEKLVFKDKYKLTRLQASFKDDRNHKAIDISTGGFDTYYVIAAFDGKVSKLFNNCSHWSSENQYSSDYKKCNCANETGYGGYGNCLEITTDTINGIEYKTLYSHLTQDSILVDEKEKVSAGDVIAIVGSSGKSFGPHLDFTIFTGAAPRTGTCYDPILFDDLFVNNEYKKGGNGVEDKYKSMFMNIPFNIQDVCTGADDDVSPCDDCLEYDENIFKKYKIKVK